LQAKEELEATVEEERVMLTTIATTREVMVALVQGIAIHTMLGVEGCRVEAKETMEIEVVVVAQ
jgi:hypothetical protein